MSFSFFGWNSKDKEMKSEARRMMEEYRESDEYKAEMRKAAIEMLEEDRVRQQEEEQNRLRQHQEDMDKAESDLKLLKEKMADSPEPWVYIVGSGIDPSRGISVELEWNDSFIRFLRQQGIDGANDEDVVQVWLAHLSSDIDKLMIAEDYLYSDTEPMEKFSGDMDELIKYDEQEEDFDTGRE